MNLVTGNKSFYWQTPEGTAKQTAAEHPFIDRDTDIINDFVKGLRVSELAVKYGLSESSIRRIINGKDER